MSSDVRDDENYIGALVRARALETLDAHARDASSSSSSYTAFAAFVVVERDARERDEGPRVRVASWATGTKCVAKRRRGTRGDVVGDCHAETLARRAFRRWLCEEYESARDGKPSVFVEVDREGSGAEDDGGAVLVKMRSGVEVHAYCSQSPCGDASVFAAPAERDGSIGGGREEASAIAGGERLKRAKTMGSMGGGAGTTGAKIFDGATAGGGGGADSEREAATQEVGAIRWKPGRGDPSFCLSCSDKLCRWGMEGVQGKLLRHVVLEPVRLTSVCVSAPRVAEESRAETRRVVRAALERAIARRVREGVGEDAPPAPRCVVVDPHDRVGLSSYASVVAGDRAASPLSLVATGPSTATRSSTTHHPPTVERVLGAKGYRHGCSKSSVDAGAAASEHAPSRYARAFARAVLSRASPACRARFAAMSYREAKSCAPRAARAAFDANPVARRLFAPLPGKSAAALDAGDFHPFTDASSTA